MSDDFLRPPDTSKLDRLIEERRKQKAEEVEQDNQYQDLVPDDGYERTESDKQLDSWIERLSIVDAYNKWCGKSTPSPHPGQTESVMVSCPIPGHTDKHPSAWLNLDKKTWFCGGCQIGGDSFDLAAYHFNYPVPGYKEGANFPKLREEMAKSFGFTFEPPIPGTDNKPVVIPPPKKTVLKIAPDLPPDPDPESEEETASVTQIDGSDIDEELEKELPTLDWRKLIEPGTFIDAFTTCTEPDDIPSEYNFWNALTGVGLAVGQDVTLHDRIPVQGNMYVCIVGYTGDGKSRSYRHLEKVLTEALPWNRTEDKPKGVQIIKGAGSGEVIIQSFAHQTDTGEKVPVRGLIHYDEMASFSSRSARTGNTLKPIMQEIYDSPPTLATRTKTGGRPGQPLIFEAVHPFASAFASSQPAVFKKMFQEEDLDSGFLNRWVFITGERKERISIGDHMIDMTPAVAPLQEIHGWAGFGKTITWTDAAYREFNEFYHEVIVPTQQRDKTQLLARSDLTMKKNILQFAVNELESEVQVSHVTKAISMFDYLTVIYNILGVEVRTSPFAAMQNDILNFVTAKTVKNSRGCSQGEVNRYIKRRGFDITRVQRILDTAGKMRMITVIDERKDPNLGMGRPTIRYISNMI